MGVSTGTDRKVPRPNGDRQVFVYHFVGQGYKNRQQSAFSAGPPTWTLTSSS